MTSGVLDHGPAGFVLMAQAKEGKPAPAEKILKVIEYVEAALHQSFSISLSTDYGPEYTLTKLIDACDIRGATWPSKSSIYASWGGKQGRVRCSGVLTVATGYHAPSDIYSQVPERKGWIASRDFHIAAPLRAMVADEIVAGRSDVAIFTAW